MTIDRRALNNQVANYNITDDKNHLKGTHNSLRSRNAYIINATVWFIAVNEQH